MNEKSELMAMLAPNPGRYAPLDELPPRAEVAVLARALFREGYDDHIAGHISYHQSDGSILVNPWELAWDELHASDILRIDAESGRVTEGDWNVTPAIGLHLALYRRRNDVGVVIHNHSRFGSIWAAAHRVPPVYDQTSAQVDGEIALVDEYGGAVHQSGEADAALEGLGDHKWAILANHGVLVVGKDIRQAHLRAVTLEWRCRVAWHVETLGKGVPLNPAVADGFGAMVDGNGFPFLWEAMARREIRRDPTVLD